MLVATPIGNLGDMSSRAVETLKGADHILCEDTRYSARLFAQYGIDRPHSSYAVHNTRSRLPWILEQLKGGRQIAYVCDAGTPGISDPGTVLVRASIEAGHPVTAIPGPSAMLMALILSGLPTDRFAFDGFLPHKKGRQTRLRELAQEKRTIILYESPHRILKSLTELNEYLGNRQAAIARELTKVFEEVRRGKLADLLEHFTHTSPRGEFVIVVAGTAFKDDEQDDENPLHTTE